MWTTQNPSDFGAMVPVLDESVEIATVIAVLFRMQKLKNFALCCSERCILGSFHGPRAARDFLLKWLGIGDILTIRRLQRQRDDCADCDAQSRKQKSNIQMAPFIGPHLATGHIAQVSSQCMTQ